MKIIHQGFYVNNESGTSAYNMSQLFINYINIC